MHLRSAASQLRDLADLGWTFLCIWGFKSPSRLGKALLGFSGRPAWACFHGEAAWQERTEAQKLLGERGSAHWKMDRREEEHWALDFSNSFARSNLPLRTLPLYF